MPTVPAQASNDPKPESVAVIDKADDVGKEVYSLQFILQNPHPFRRKLVAIKPNHKRTDRTRLIPLTERIVTSKPDHERKIDTFLIDLSKNVVPAQQSNDAQPESAGLTINGGSTKPMPLVRAGIYSEVEWSEWIQCQFRPNLSAACELAILPITRETKQLSREPERVSTSGYTLLRKYQNVLPWDVHDFTNIDEEDDIQKRQSDVAVPVRTESADESVPLKRKTIFDLIRLGLRRKRSVRVHTANCVRDKKNENRSMRSIANSTQLQHCQCEQSIKVSINKSYRQVLNCYEPYFYIYLITLILLHYILKNFTFLCIIF